MPDITPAPVKILAAIFVLMLCGCGKHDECKQCNRCSSNRLNAEIVQIPATYKP